jgi:two-component system LytT family response regulator
MLRTIIVDDEDHQRLTIEKMVKLHCRNVSIVYQADGVQSGVDAIKKYKPDLVLLDIKMDDGTGFDLLERLHPIDFKVIFITAYDQFAIKAFRLNAIDYLLKPLDPDELVQAVEKVEHIIQKDFNAQLDNLKEHLTADNKANKKIIIKTFDNIHLVPIKEILYCESDGNYVSVHLASNPKIMVSASLKDYEDMLAGDGFFRVHKTYLINLKYIRRFEKAEGGSVVLDGEIKIPVASRKREHLLEMFERISK